MTEDCVYGVLDIFFPEDKATNDIFLWVSKIDAAKQLIAANKYNIADGDNGGKAVGSSSGGGYF